MITDCFDHNYIDTVHTRPAYWEDIIMLCRVIAKQSTLKNNYFVPCKRARMSASKILLPPPLQLGRYQDLLKEQWDH